MQAHYLDYSEYSDYEICNSELPYKDNTCGLNYYSNKIFLTTSNGNNYFCEYDSENGDFGTMYFHFNFHKKKKKKFFLKVIINLNSILMY